MKTIINRTFLSSGDLKRLKESFFSPSSPAEPQATHLKKKLILSVSFFSVFLAVAVIFFSNFHVVILPDQKRHLQNGTVDLLAEKALATPTLIAPCGDSRVAKKLIYLNIPPGEKGGFTLDFKEKMDMSKCKVALVLTNPQQDLDIALVLRDNRFFSNALDPIVLRVPYTGERNEYIKVPVEIDHDVTSNINLLKVSQLRFIFSRQKSQASPIFVKNVFFEKRR